ncbi:MAG: riboflavin biosynthesis protein RibF [Planctomycetota bacterium]
MELLHGLDAMNHLPRGAALSVGNFDGIHLGHQKIIDHLADAGTSGVVVATFEPHPTSVLRPDLAPPRLTSVERKRALLAEAGVTHLVELPADDSVLKLEAKAFCEAVRDRAEPAVWAEGHDFRFGRGAIGNVDRLTEWLAESGVSVEIVEQATVVLPGLQVVSASSSLVRWLVVHGRVCDAAAVLGRKYSVSGEVVRGAQRGRTIGFPTANVQVDDHLVPADGVYAGRCDVDGASHVAAVSIGTNPTFDGPVRTVEAYLVGFEGDLYGRHLSVTLERWLRGQERYSGVDPLVRQLNVDVEQAVRLVA